MKIRVKENVLTDGSKVFDVILSNGDERDHKGVVGVVIPSTTYVQAWRLAYKIKDAVDYHAVEDATIED